MKKKYLFLSASIAILFFIILIPYYNVGFNKITYTALTEQTLNQIHKNYKESTDDILTDFRFNGQELAYDASTSTYYLPLSLSEEKWEDGSFSTTSTDIDMSFLDSFREEDKLECIYQNKSFRFIAYNESKYKEYKLVFTGLATMTIITKEAVDSTRLLADFSLYDNSAREKNVITSEGYLQLRGATSRSYPKYGYRINLIKKSYDGMYENNDVSFLGMRNDNDWILNALYNDDTKIRNMLSEELWNEMGATNVDSSAFYGSHMEYVEVFLNNQYIGLYSLIEPIDYKQLSLNLTAGEYLYKRVSGTVLSDDAFDIETQTTVTEENLSGFEIKGNLSPIYLKDWLPLKNVVSLLTEPSDTIYQTKAEEIVNISNCLDIWIFLQTVSGFDNITKNMYFAYKSVGNQYCMYFVPWDLDLTWGYEYTTDNNLFSRYNENRVLENVPWEPGQRIYDLNINESQNEVSKRWATFRSTCLSEDNIKQIITKYYELLTKSGAMARDEARWSDSPHTTDFSTIINYAVKRLQYLDSQFIKP